MNRETTKTLIFVAVAALLMGAAFVNMPDRRKDEVFVENGQPFFPDFKDPNACTSLEVVDYDPETTIVTPFKVLLKDGKWTVPSHYDYPADGKDRLVKTSVGVMDLKKDALRSEAVADHEKLGVVDPLDAKATTLKGQGKRVTLKDGSDKVLADFIIGKEVENRPGQRFVRVPGAEADVCGQRQARPLDPVRRLDRDEPAEGRHGQGPQGRLQQPEAGDRRPRPGEGRPGRGRDDRAQGRHGPLVARRRPGPRGEGAGHRQALRPDDGPGRRQDRRRPPEARRADPRAGGHRRHQGYHQARRPDRDDPGHRAGPPRVLPRRRGRVLSNQGDIVVSTEERRRVHPPVRRGVHRQRRGPLQGDRRGRDGGGQEGPGGRSRPRRRRSRAGSSAATCS